MLKESDQLKSGVLLSYAQMGISIVLSLLYTPYTLRMLGRSEYGTQQTVMSSVSMLSILSLGFYSSYVRYYSIYKARKDDDAIYRLNGMFLLIFMVLGGIVLLCGVYLAFNLKLVFANGLTAQEYTTARILMFIATANMALSFPKGVFTNIIASHERYIFLKLVSAIQSIIDPILNVVVLWLGYKSIAMTVVSLVLSIITFIIYAVYTVAKLKQKFIFHGFEHGLFASLCHFTGFILINMIVDMINNQTDKLLLARYCGTAEVSVYSIGSFFCTQFTNFSTSISGIFTPKVHRMVLDNEQDKAKQRTVLTAFFTKVGRIQLLLLMLIASGFVFFGQPFIARWAGVGYEESYYVALVMMIPSIIPLTQNVGIEIQRAENRHQYRSYIYAFVAIFNFISSLYLCQIWGAFGAALCTGLASIIGNSIIMDIVYHKLINIDMIAYWKDTLRMLVGIVPSFAVGVLIMRYATMTSYLQIALYALLYVSVYAALAWRFSMNSQEKQLVMSGLRKFKLIRQPS